MLARRVAKGVVIVGLSVVSIALAMIGLKLAADDNWVGMLLFAIAVTGLLVARLMVGDVT